MGSGGADIQLSAAAKAIFPFSVEAKARAKIGLVYDALEQAKRDDGLPALAFVKADRKPVLAVIDADYFFALLSMAKGG